MMRSGLSRDAGYSIEKGNFHPISLCTVEPHYNEDLGTMKITLLYQVFHYIRVYYKNKI